MPLKKALWALWNMYAEQRDGRVSEAIDASFDKLNLRDEKRELEKVIQNLEEQLNKSMNERQVGEVEMRKKAEKERDELKQEKKNLEYVIADLIKAGDVMKQKLKKINAIILDENV